MTLVRIPPTIPLCEAPMPFLIRPLRRLPLAYVLGFGSLITLVVLSSGPAYGEWVSVGSSQSQGGYIGHVDPDTIRRNGDLVKMWQLYDVKTIQTFGDAPYLSAKIRSEYDCAEERWRLLALTNFSGNMGTGTAVSSNSHEGEWAPVQPDSIGQIMWNLACGKM